jgi:hypothetical protein
VEAVRTRQATIDDLLERLLDKGVILNLDLVIGVAGIPLIGINLRAAIASIETMIEYGYMQAWDEQLRDYANGELRRKKLALAAGETILLDMYGSHWYSNGIYRAWRPGRLYLTDRRLILYRAEPAEVLFQTPLAAIRDLLINRETYFTGAERDLLYLSLGEDEVASVYAEDLPALHAALVERLALLGTVPAGDLMPFLRAQEMGGAIRERVVAEGKVWWQAPGSGIHGTTWRPGWLYLTVERLLWWSDFDHKVQVDIPLGKLRRINLEQRPLGGLLGGTNGGTNGGVAGSSQDLRDVLAVTTGTDGRRAVTLFAGDALPQWRRQIKDQVLDFGADFEEGDSDA